MNKPCSKCPWTSREQRDKAALSPQVRAAAVKGEWFCCHVNMGTCFGAERYGAAKNKAITHPAAAGEVEK